MSASDDDETLRIWNVNDGTVQKVLEGHSNPIAFSPDSITQASRLACQRCSASVSLFVRYLSRREWINRRGRRRCQEHRLVVLIRPVGLRYSMEPAL